MSGCRPVAVSVVEPQPARIPAASAVMAASAARRITREDIMGGAFRCQETGARQNTGRTGRAAETGFACRPAVF
ncbi:hypothetical protein GCM10009733_026120 [Nonomuraea maheshkhaliensis]|uniref:Uncharacterized protein n=1 Tax=Nonomuraea maheshkhaliensis TaxID=419590 RepID=A0ABN2F4V6_9ACTN